MGGVGTDPGEKEDIPGTLGLAAQVDEFPGEFGGIGSDEGVGQSPAGLERVDVGAEAFVFADGEKDEALCGFHRPEAMLGEEGFPGGQDPERRGAEAVHIGGQSDGTVNFRGPVFQICGCELFHIQFHTVEHPGVEKAVLERVAPARGEKSEKGQDQSDGRAVQP